MINNIERQIIEIIATDRIDIPISSMSGKLKREKKKLAQSLELEDENYLGDRVYARVEKDDTMKARGMKQGIEKFEGEFPRYGKILKGMIEEQRAKSEINLYFGVHEGCRLASNDYMGVLTDLGFSEIRADTLYKELMKVSRNLSKKRDEERSILIG